MRRPLLFIAATACTVLAVSPVVARADFVPAPPSEAHGVALQVGSLLDISKTDATAGSGTTSAQASVIRLGGQPLLDLGGVQKGDGETGGALLDTGAGAPIRLEVAPWHAAVSGTSGPKRHSKASAALARAAISNLVRLGVLTSTSEASYTDAKSTGTASSDGIDLGLLEAVRVVLLHSEVATEGHGHSYLIGVNGTEIGTDDQLGSSPICGLNVPNVLALSCLAASGGVAGNVNSGAAEVAKATPAADALEALSPVAAIVASSSSGSGQPGITVPAPVNAVQAAEAERTTVPEAPAVKAAEAAGPGALPRTGSGAASLAASALAALLAGFGLRRFGFRPGRS
jgi:hypothetical protein